MPRIVFSLLALSGVLLAFVGLIVQKRAASTYGKPGVPRGITMNPSHWWPAWRFAGEMTDAKGVRMYVRGLELFNWGVTIAAFALGYIAGHW